MKQEVGSAGYRIENKAVVRPRMARERYPFDKMKMGQSFYFEPISIGDLNNMRTAAVYYGRRNDMKFSIIRDGQGYRCGRIK